MDIRFVTTLGCSVKATPAPEHLGPGVILSLAMHQEGDGRRAEVFLTPEEWAQLGKEVS